MGSDEGGRDQSEQLQASPKAPEPVCIVVLGTSETVGGFSDLFPVIEKQQDPCQSLGHGASLF
jgi:hypothetical protein